jgi:hypothetical protein
MKTMEKEQKIEICIPLSVGKFGINFKYIDKIRCMVFLQKLEDLTPMKNYLCNAI